MSIVKVVFWNLYHEVVKKSVIGQFIIKCCTSHAVELAACRFAACRFVIVSFVNFCNSKTVQLVANYTVNIRHMLFIRVI